MLLSNTNIIAYLSGTQHIIYANLCQLDTVIMDKHYYYDYIVLRMRDTKTSTCLLRHITTEKSGLCQFAVCIAQNTTLKSRKHWMAYVDIK